MADWLALGGSIKRRGCWTPGFEFVCICNIETTLPTLLDWRSAVQNYSLPPYLYYWARHCIWNTKTLFQHLYFKQEAAHWRSFRSYLISNFKSLYEQRPAQTVSYNWSNFIRCLQLDSVRIENGRTAWVGRVETKLCWRPTLCIWIIGTCSV